MREGFRSWKGIAAEAKLVNLRELRIEDERVAGRIVGGIGLFLEAIREFLTQHPHAITGTAEGVMEH